MPDLATALAPIVMPPGRRMGNNLVENMGLNPQTNVIQKDSYDVESTYIGYKVDHRTVCNSYRSEVLAYSECSHAVVKVFAEGCKMDSFGDKPQAQAKRLKIMFCNAAIVALISGHTINKPKQETCGN